MIDLHVHSTASDGTFTPAQLVALAEKSGVCAFALTDHDSTDGIEESLDAAAKSNIQVIPGIELSTEYNEKEIHVVGLYIDWKCPALVKRFFINVSSWPQIIFMSGIVPLPPLG